jgi:hypothetical protein
MKRTQVGIFFLFVVFALASLTFAGIASAGWTWDDGPSASDGAAQ